MMGEKTNIQNTGNNQGVMSKVINGDVTINIDSVKLRYTRISEKDSFDTGLLVPVWDFIGTKTDQYGNEVHGAILMSINAIDGSVIDRNLGY